MKGKILDLLRRTMAGYIRNPNIGGMLVVSLHEGAYGDRSFFETENLQEGPYLKKLVVCEEGGTRNSVQKGIDIVYDMLQKANTVTRTSVPVKELIVGLKCGATNAMSGISANPALGVASDLLVKQGATVILSETMELYEVQDEFLQRAADTTVAEKFQNHMNWWIRAVQLKKILENDNPYLPHWSVDGSIGEQINKGLGIKKSGTSPIMEVYQYGEQVDRKGLVFMDTPGYDAVAVTGQIAGGATLIAYTTGNGSCFGAYPSPVLKMAASDEVYEQMLADTDMSCGGVLQQEVSVEEMGHLIYDKLLKVASGEMTKAELNGVGRNEYSPWQIGSIG
jgi:altronate hydrolase